MMNNINQNNMNTNDGFKHMVSLISVVGIFIVIGILEFHPLPPDNKDVVNIAIGAILGGLITRIAGHYFPSSSSYKVDDNDKINKRVEPTNNDQPA